MEKAKLYNLSSGTYTSNDIKKCLLKISERKKLISVQFKERITKKDPISILSLCSIQKKGKKWKSFEDAVKRIEKIGKINGKKRR